jgi:hypothetical protein
MSYKKQVSIKACSYCFSQSRTDVTGFYSVRMDKWFCHKYCHNLSLFSTSNVVYNQALSQELINSKKRLFPEIKVVDNNGREYYDATININRKKLRDDIRNKRVRVIKSVMEDLDNSDEFQDLEGPEY